MSPPSDQQPLRLRARPDVVAAAVRVAGSPRWVVTDPVTLSHYDLSEQEYALLSALGENASLSDLRRGFEQRFAPRRISFEQIWRVVSRLHREGLAVAVSGEQGERLVDRGRKSRREALLWSWTRLLAIKLPGVNPDPLLQRISPCLRWLLSLPMLLLCVAVMAAALTMVLTDFAAFAAGLPRLEDLLAPRAALALLVTAVGVKVLHELGHALACKRMGGQVGEMGVLLLAFAPALYCDVSDLWRLPSKWKRVAVTSAGIFVELCLAAVAALVWRYSESGLLQIAAMNVMIVCTVGTLLVNANPLMRYDGYYLLSDLTETPNLWTRSREAVRDLWSALFVRGARHSPARPWWLPLYGLVSQAYLLVVVVSIVWMLVVTLRPYRLEVLAYIAGLVAAAGAVAPAMRRAARQIGNPSNRRRLRGGRAAATAVCGLVLLSGILALPWRYSVEGAATVELREPRPVVATVAGRLVRALPAGAEVSQGDVVAELTNPDTRREVLRVQASLEAARLKVAHLQLTRSHDREANDRLPAAHARVRDLSVQLASLEHHAARLTLRAERSGVVVRSRHSRRSAESEELTLARWNGALTDPENQGAWVETGQSVADIADPHAVEALVVLDEADIERLAIGQSARIAWLQTPGLVSRGKVVEIAEHSSRRHAQDSASPGGPGYLVRVQLNNPPANLMPGGAGRARIETASTSLGRLAVTRVRQLFRLP